MKRFCFHNRLVSPGLVLGALLAGIALVMGGCGDGDDASAPALPETPDQGFTFLNLGRNTQLTEPLRAALRNELGSEAIEQKTTLNLEPDAPGLRGGLTPGPDAPGLLETLFPFLHGLNEQLNYLPRQRIEHNTVKLRYRYAIRKNVPFKYVELIFSNATRRPLLFIIRADEAGAAILESLKEKYGEPERKEEGVPGAPVLYWINEQDYLVVTSGRDNFGHATYQISFYFGTNLQALVDAEEEARKKAAEQIRRAGRQAF